MTYFSRRLQSTLSKASAAEASAEILQRFGNKPISVRKQLLDANQLQLLSLTLGRSNLHKNQSIADSAPVAGTPLPPGYHLAYFTPAQLESQLGQDGTDRTVNPLAPYTRRMWAGGELEWSQEPDQLLRVGQTVQEVTKILTAEPKRLRSGDDMIVVGVEKHFENEKGVSLIDRRSWVFQKEIADSKPPSPTPELVSLPEGSNTRDFCQDLVTLFRFSALTFNGHKIHYSREWCREVEGHRNCVVHGPLNLINMLDLWRDTARFADAEAVPKSIAYRAVSPLYVGERYRILVNKDADDDKWSAEIWDSYGKTSMKGSIVE